MTQRLIAALVLLAGPLGMPAAPALAGSEYNTAGVGDIAIGGTDPVGYFTQSMALRGLPKFSYRWKGAIWHFGSAANRAAFKVNPMRYAPQYGGYSAWQVARGYTARIDPEAWRIVDYKLYLNYSKAVRRKWSSDLSGNITNGDHNWPGIRASLIAK